MHRARSLFRLCVLCTATTSLSAQDGSSAIDWAHPGEGGSSGLFVDVAGDGRPELLRLTDEGGLELDRFDQVDQGVPCLLPPELEDLRGVARLGLETAGAHARLVLLDEADRPRVYVLDGRGDARVVLDLWTLPGVDRERVQTAPDTEPESARGDQPPALARVKSPGRPRGAPRPGRGGTLPGTGADPGTQEHLGPGDGPGGRVADVLIDAVDGTRRLFAFSVPTLGALYPITPELFVSPAGTVGLGTTVPAEQLHVASGSVRVDGGFSLGRSGMEELRVREAADGRPTLDLRDALGRTTVSLGESLDGSGRRAGIELFDPQRGEAIATTLATQGLALRDAPVGVTGVELTGDSLEISSGNRVTVQLGGDEIGDDVTIWTRDGAAAIRAYENIPGLGGGRFEVKGDGRVAFVRAALSTDGVEAETYLDVDTQVHFSTDRSNYPQGTPAAPDSGSLRVRSSSGSDRVALDALTTDGDARLVLSYLGSEHLRLTSEGGFGGGTLEVRRYDGTVVLRAEGKHITGEGGALTAFDSSNGTPTVKLDADPGAAFSISNQAAVEIIRLDAGAGSLTQRYADTGQPSMIYDDGVLSLCDESGTPTITFNGETGEKTAVVSTRDHGARLLYAIESPEVWFEDGGESALSDGFARVSLDPVFLETIVVSEEEPLIVLVTPTAACRGLFVEADRTGFSVRERGRGSSNASFDWRVLARAQGQEGVRTPIHETRQQDRTEVQ